MLLLLQLFTLFLLVLLGFYVFVAAPRQRSHQTFAAFISLLAVWTVKDIVLWSFQGADAEAGWWAATSFVIAFFLQCSLVVFAWVFPENSRTPRRKAAVIFAPALVFVPAALFGLLWKRVGFRDGQFEIELSATAYGFVFYIYAIFAYGAFLLLKKYKSYRLTQKGQQIGAILWALGITFVLLTLANIVFPVFDDYRLLPYGAIFFLPGVLIYAYAISNFRLFSLQTALDQFRLFPITYKIALSIAAVAVVSFAVFQIPIVWWAFQDGTSFEAWRRYLVFSVISALVPNLLLVLIIMRIFSRPLQRITLAAVQVSDGAYGTQADLRRTNDEIGLLATSFNEMSRKMASDIAELQRLNEQLMRTEKLAAMGTLAAGVAHEVNNPLASISSLIQMMRARPNLDAETGEMLDLISSQIKRITQVTRDMMDFARVRPAAKTDADINDILETSLRLASFDHTFRQLRIVKNYQSDLPRVSADVDQMQQVFLNLFLNARDAMPGGGVITLKTANEGRGVEIEVSDTGAGIGETDLKKIFDPFYTTKPAGKGTGLGLAVCYGIITAHGGRIEAAANAAGGTIFKISLPENQYAAYKRRRRSKYIVL